MANCTDAEYEATVDEVARYLEVIERDELPPGGQAALRRIELATGATHQPFRGRFTGGVAFVSLSQADGQFRQTLYWALYCELYRERFLGLRHYGQTPTHGGRSHS